MMLRTAIAAWACLWYYGTDMHGKPKTLSVIDPANYVQQLTDHSEHGRRMRISLIPEPEPPKANIEERYKARSDAAATLVYQGKTREAIEILTEVEKEKPGEYIVAANLGTAYELHGDLASARRWISEAIARNANAHYGTEWLHLLILDARMALAKDPKWLETHSVLGVDFGKGPEPQSPWPWPKGQSPQSTQTALQYQLHERMGFVPAPDPVVGDLLFDLGNMLSSSMTVEHAIAVYDLALTYKPVQEELVLKRRAHLQGVIDGRHRTKAFKQVGGTVGVALILLALVGFWMRARARSAAQA